MNGFLAAGAWVLPDLMAASAAAGAVVPPPTPARAVLSSNQMFALAEAAQKRGDTRLAEAAYRALGKDAALPIRSEARFRLAMIFVQQRNLAGTALLLRQILNEQPSAARVRLELARVVELMGDEGRARRLLREARAGSLPPQVARFVDHYSAALRARKPSGASLDVAVAPDSNINRGTANETLGTSIGDFTLDENARQQSGTGLALRGQVYRRFRLSGDIALSTRFSGSADLYKKSKFNDVAVGLMTGPEITLGKDRLSVEAGLSKRMFGGKLFMSTATLGATYLHPLDGVSQLRAAASIGRIAHRLNRLQSGTSYAASLGYERALSPTTGVGATLAFDRQSLRDPGYSTRAAQATIFAYREFGPTTLVASFGTGRLKADERLFLYPSRREDRFSRISLGATIRRAAVAGFAPFVRLTWERNHSSIELFDYRRTRTETGITRAF